MNTLKILLAFDHELSLGGSGCYVRNLFDPSDRLLDLAAELDVPITLFTDVCCAMRFREWDREGFFDDYCRQIRRAVRENHDIQLHLHPHWIDSEYGNGRFIPAKSYRLSCFRERAWPDSIRGIVERGVEFLNDLCLAEYPEYECIAYRAGGFDMAPATADILTALYEQGIRIDSSIAKGNCFASELWQVDHRGMPGRANWTIATSGPLDREASSGIYEIPIATRPRTPLNNLPFLFKRVLYRGRRYRSGGWGIDVGNTSIADKIGRAFPHSAWMLGFDNHTDRPEDLMRILGHHIDAHPEDEMIACSTVSHPKNMGAYARSLMKGFVEAVRRQFGRRATFCTFQQYFDEFLAHADCKAPSQRHEQ